MPHVFVTPDVPNLEGTRGRCEILGSGISLGAVTLKGQSSVLGKDSCLSPAQSCKSNVQVSLTVDKLLGTVCTQHCGAVKESNALCLKGLAQFSFNLLLLKERTSLGTTASLLLNNVLQAYSVRRIPGC